MENAFISLLAVIAVASLAIYWTLFKTRKDVTSALLEIRKVLESK